MNRIIVKINTRLLNIFFLIVFLKLYLSFQADAVIFRCLFRVGYVGLFAQLLWLINHDIISVFEKIRKCREKKNINKKENGNV